VLIIMALCAADSPSDLRRRALGRERSWPTLRSGPSALARGSGGFWAEAAEEIHWDKTWRKVLDDSNQPLYRWFVGGEVNTCYNAVIGTCKAAAANRRR